MFKTSLSKLPANKVREARQILYIMPAGGLIMVSSGLILNAVYPEVYDPLSYRIISAIMGFVFVGVLLKSHWLISKHLHLCFNIYAFGVFALVAWTTANSGNSPTWIMGWYVTAMAIQLVYTRVNDILIFMAYAVALTAFMNTGLENPQTPASWMFSLITTSGLLTYLALRHRLMLIEELKTLNQTILEQSQELDAERARSFNSSKLASLGEVSGGIAHEINNPLTIIQGQAYLLKKQLKANPTHDPASIEVCDQMMSTINRIAKIIKGIRNFSRDGSGDPFELIEVRKVIHDSLALFSEKMSSMGIKVGVTGDEEPHSIMGQEIQLSQVFVNLISNAQHVADRAQEKWINVSILSSQEFIEIEVSNSGDLIPDEVREKLFQPFFTTKKVGEGTGLGLSISRGIVQSHKGDIFLRENASHTTFVVKLPRAKPGSANESPEQKDLS